MLVIIKRPKISTSVWKFAKLSGVSLPTRNAIISLKGNLSINKTIVVITAPPKVMRVRLKLKRIKRITANNTMGTI